MLEWRTLCPSNDPKHLVRGTELEYCIPAGFLSRFKIVSVRTILRDTQWNDDDWQNATRGRIMGSRIVHDVRYRIRDAATVTDAEIRQGVEPRVIGEFATLDEALAAIEPFRYKESEQ